MRGNRWALTAGAAVPLLTTMAAGCLQMPADGTRLASVDDPVLYSGIVGTSGAKVRAKASSSASGAPTVVGTTFASTVPVPSTQFFAWSTAQQIPGNLWSARSDVDGEGCPLWATYVSADSGGATLKVSHADPSDSAPYIRLLGYPPLVAPGGGITISTQAEADALHCAHVIVGNLTVADSLEYVIALPNLERVSGNLTITYPSRTIGGPNPGSTCQEARQLHAPLLHEVGGDVVLTVVTSKDFQSVDVGLEALTHVGGSFTVNSSGHPDIALAGVDQLVNVPGTVTVNFPTDTGCYSSGGLVGIGGVCVLAPARPPLLDALTSAGSGLVATQFESYCILRHLAHVEHDLVIKAKLPGVSFLPALHDVGGDLRFENGVKGSHWAPPLAAAGRIVITGTTLSEWPLQLPIAAPLPTVGGVDIQGNANLTSLAGASLTLQPATAPVTILNNTSLPAPQVCSFVTAVGAVSPTLDVTCGP